MLCPDVDNFRTNQRHRSRVKSGKVADTSLKEEVVASVARLGAVRGVAVVLPSPDPAPDPALASSVAALLGRDTQHYAVADFSPGLVFSRDFVSNFLCTGSLHIVTPRDHGPRVSLYNKVLHLTIPSDLNM